MISPRLALAATFLTVAIAVPSVVVAAEASSASTSSASTSASTASTSTTTAHTTSSRLAKPAAKEYKNCTAIKKVYSGGIAKKGVKYNVVKHKDGTKTNKALKGKVKFDTALYNANKKSDADKDGIACEKS